jgi:hypothetical protein
MPWDFQEFSVGGLAFVLMMVAQFLAVIVLNRGETGDSSSHRPPK